MSQKIGETIVYGSVDRDNKLLLNVTREVEGVAREWEEGTEISRLFTAKDLNDFQDSFEDHITAENPHKIDPYLIGAQRLYVLERDNHKDYIDDLLLGDLCYIIENKYSYIWQGSKWDDYPGALKQVGGWLVTETTLYSENIVLDSDNDKITVKDDKIT